MRIAVLGGTGFVGHHVARRLQQLSHWVLVVDIEPHRYGELDYADDLWIADLRNKDVVSEAVAHVDQVFQFAADMGGCQYVFTGEHDADIMHNSAMINLNVCEALKGTKTRVFYSSSACMYPQGKQSELDAVALKEFDAYPADPDSEYGWEKIFSERLYLAYARNYGLDVRIARYHNIYGPEGIYQGGREKAPASIARKVAEGKSQVWGDGLQRRSFLYIDDCVDATLALMDSDWKEPINIGSEESVSINDLWEMAIAISGKSLILEHVERPGNFLGVKARNSDNALIRQVLNWEPKYSLRAGMEKTYTWIEKMLHLQ